jgi:hypothetical protein
MSVNSIDSDQYVDGSIDNAHIADDAIDSEHYADGSIDTAHIADDQVTLAKMAGLARGKVIIGDSGGNPSALALGTLCLICIKIRRIRYSLGSRFRTKYRGSTRYI